MNQRNYSPGLKLNVFTVGFKHSWGHFLSVLTYHSPLNGHVCPMPTPILHLEVGVLI